LDGRGLGHGRAGQSTPFRRTFTAAGPPPAGITRRPALEFGPPPVRRIPEEPHVLVFSEEWCAAWCAALNAEPAYAQAAATWEGAVVLVAEGEGVARSGAWLDLHHGACRDARPASPADEVTA